MKKVQTEVKDLEESVHEFLENFPVMPNVHISQDGNHCFI